MKKIPPKFLLLAVGVGVVIFLFSLVYYSKFPLGAKVQIRNTVFQVELAIKPEELVKGLGSRANMPKDHGMLFVFDHRDRFSFWMKDMEFPLDMIWIDDTKIVDISKNVPVQTGYPLPTFSPHVPVNRVLEINAGLSDKYGFQVGDTVTYLKR